MATQAGTISSTIARRLEEGAEIRRAIAGRHSGDIERIADRILGVYRAGGKVVAFGNGGSAADAQHLVGELVGGFLRERQPLPAMALTTNASVLTAIANDHGYARVFSRQVEALVNETDAVIAISTSGNSPCVIEAVRAASLKGAISIGLTGGDGGRLAGVVDIALTVPSSSTPLIQEAHTAVAHIVCEIVELALAVPPAGTDTRANRLATAVQPRVP